MTATHPRPTLAWATCTVAGAGLVDLTLGVRLLGGSPGWGLALVGLGVAQVLWAAATLARARPLLARTALTTLVIAAGGWSVVVLQGLGPVGPAGAGRVSSADASVVGLQLLGLVGLAVVHRRTVVRTGALGAQGRGVRDRHHLRNLIGWVLAAGVATAITTPALTIGPGTTPSGPTSEVRAPSGPGVGAPTTTAPPADHAGH
ncbi:hypothetical protein [Actinotalea sp. K2]|uniref:hypothetical protein n=1 Tax=Actinotalea sp. K2 TaxID=2939438 RepID=UPI0020177783|nr:hypothetical protein [Actinotalea sp. K2]MCL3860044.1 hypothetical protein [Actinotalea sp. K2]